MVSSTILTLVVIAAVYRLVKGWGLPGAEMPTESVEHAKSPLAAE
ncbi:hypothetical protein [Methylobacterium sp. Leaf111]|nr:hypothetical protein [Methylobacterium sp. Leaf111]